ncbi:2-methylcitrate dehydratase PrpD [Calocera viscosa TUFC12733]|uniref:2-methylcitrate dehydratase PrpD n=1 Tax=Calocera viscosa (strain TUFC12733) TaxID=1330018 RepID=A0A167GR48_CALVF|nr:2-methylcitrate dehydratase PrpD [Calocera viscosa TUFC12733]
MSEANVQQETPGVRSARFAVASRDTTLPPEVAKKTMVHILDTLAAIVSGSILEAGIAGQKYALSGHGPGQATIIGTSLKAPLIEATLANGMCAHADESEDSHETSQNHPGCGVLPAVLSIAEYTKCSGEDFLRAVNLGYEITIRFGQALAPAMSFAKSSLSCHAFGPLFGAGFAVGSLLKFSEELFLILLNCLAQEASGLTKWRLDDAHTLKSYVFAGMPSSNAVKCAFMLKAGWTGQGDVLNRADRNFFDSISPNAKPEALLRGLGSEYRILETDLKKYSVGFPIAAPLAALKEIFAKNSLTADRVQSINLRYNDAWYRVIGDQNRMPDLNLRHCMAATVINGSLTFDASHNIDLMAKPQITASQGKDVLGRIDNPMTQEQSNTKANEVLCTVLPTRAAQQLIEAVWSVEKELSLERVIALIQPGQL